MNKRAGLTISFIGSSLVSVFWNGAATYYRGIIRALNERGHRITFYEPDIFERQSNRDMPDPPWCRVVVYPAQRRQELEPVLDEASKADVIIKASGVGKFDDYLEAAVLELRKPDSIVIFWDVDAPATLDRVHANNEDPFLDLISRYDLILTYGGGEPVVEAYTQLGARRCVPIYNALDPTTHFPVLPDPRFRGDIAFCGNRLPDRERRVDEFFFKPAQVLSKRKFLLGGNGWQDKSMPSNVEYLGHVYTRDHNAFNCTPMCILNISRESMARYGFSPATRVFEAAGAGSCLITDAWDGIEEFLEPTREVLVGTTGEDVAGLLSDLSPDRARRIGDAARKRVLSQHTYMHRVHHFERLIGAECVFQG